LANAYESKLQMMESWYDELVVRDDRERLLVDDYEPHRSFLGSLRGDVLDVGGGAGIAARFLDADVHYVVVDPSACWNGQDWLEFGRQFRAGGPDPEFIQASGENLPFQDSSFDVVLSYWSLNHIEDARTCIREMVRVLRPGGLARLVIDDMEPRWTDLAREAAAKLWARTTRSGRTPQFHTPLRHAVRMKASGRWPIHEDHFAIADADLLHWATPQLRTVNRQWLAGSLVYDFAKR